MDTLDYSGESLNQGSKLVIASAGSPIRELKRSIESNLHLPVHWKNPRVALPGVLVVESHRCSGGEDQRRLWELCDRLGKDHPLNQFAMIVVVDDSDFAARNMDNFVWTTFTRSNPAVDVYGIAAWVEEKHFGCDGSLVIDARQKPHHAPPLVEDSAISAKVDTLAAHGGELGKYL